MHRGFVVLCLCTFVVILYINKVFLYNQLISGKQAFLEYRRSKSDVREINKSPSIYLRQVVRTHIGDVSFIEFREEVFKRYGYNLTIPTFPFVTLDYSEPLNCSSEFEDWLDINDISKLKRPKAFIPDDDTKAFLLNKYTGISYKYSDDREKLKITYKSWENIADLVTWNPRDILRLTEDSSAISMHYAMKQYLKTGTRGLILSDEHPITEVQAIQNGAAHILSVGRMAHQSDDISSISLIEFAQNHSRYMSSFDFVASYGTMETVGLGRFGWPLDSIGDFRMVIMMGCSMKKGALLFLGLPIGKDGLIFNQKRIYGHARLPMLIAGFEWLATYSEESEMPIEISARDIDSLHKFSHLRKTLVLRKL